jgi:hypothetical protein
MRFERMRPRDSRRGRRPVCPAERSSASICEQVVSSKLPPGLGVHRESALKRIGFSRAVRQQTQCGCR